MKNILAVIPARAGSKRIPRKNITVLAGKPMIAWTIEAALSSGIFKDVLVSTDSEEIAALGRQLGAAAPFLRNAEDAGDYASIHISTLKALIRMEEYRRKNYDVVVQLMPNCPCRTKEDILNSWSHFTSSKNDFQISISKFGWMNPWWALKLEKYTITPKPLFPIEFKKRSQDLEELYCPTGAIWIAAANLFKRDRTFYGRGYKAFALNWQSAVDIDNPDDFQLAELILRSRKIKHG